MTSNQPESHDYITIDDIINQHRSPPLQPSAVNFDVADTPPPLSDCDTNEAPAAVHPRHRGRHRTSPRPLHETLRASQSDSLLIQLLGHCNYPETASKAAEELPPIPSPSSRCEDRRPSAPALRQMVATDPQDDVSYTHDDSCFAVSAFEASRKLNAALGKITVPLVTTTEVVTPGAERGDGTIADPARTRSDMTAEVATHLPGVHNTALLCQSPDLADHIASNAQPALNVRPPPRLSLPSIRTRESEERPAGAHARRDSLADSPAIGKFTIRPASRHPEQQLPAMQISPELATSGLAQVSRQTLPSLETTLSAISGSQDPAFSARPSSHFGGSTTAMYPTHSPASAISPPRIPTAPAYYRTASRETTHSTPSDHTSAAASTGISTPASSAPGNSPGESAATPSAVLQEVDSRYLDGGSASTTPNAVYVNGSHLYSEFAAGSFKCTQPGCTAPPFQTQYLLNSHANVHSNTRPHFCSEAGCPRGPGGQGFKRKNEMIRHGLVHQSPGYVCPFCPDQRHKYPRPDNLQRHVRVHHVDKDRDDPLLRDVLAQRPEGGNRGRRRRLGS